MGTAEGIAVAFFLFFLSLDTMHGKIYLGLQLLTELETKPAAQLGKSINRIASI